MVDLMQSAQEEDLEEGPRAELVTNPHNQVWDAHEDTESKLSPSCTNNFWGCYFMDLLFGGSGLLRIGL